MLSMPFVFAQLGVGQGLVMLLIAALFAILGLCLLAQSAQTLNSRDVSFNCLAKTAFPGSDIISSIMSASIVIMCFGGAVSYLIVGMFLPVFNLRLAGSLLPNITGILNRHIWVSIGLAIVCPLAFLRRLDSLRYVSFLAMFCISFIVGIVVFYAILWPVGMPPQRIAIDQIMWWKSDVFALLRLSPIFVFAFACHPNLFSIHNELQSNTNKRMTGVILITSIISYTFISSNPLALLFML
jgi:amino acid permease